MNQNDKRDLREGCALCGRPFAGKVDDSKEHIIPNAIGGRRRVRGFLCRDCNASAGAKWDAELARQLNPISNLLNIKRERGAPPALVVKTTGGQRLRRRSDGHMTLDQYEVSEQRKEGKTTLRVTAPTVQVLKRHLSGLVRKYPQLKGVDLLQHAVPKSNYLADPMAIELNFGGLEVGRSVVKSCAALAHAAGVRLADLEYAREYLAGRDDPCFGHYNEEDVVLNRPPKTFFHCVYVRGENRTGKVHGYVEYFGYQRIVALLSDSYSGKAFAEGYAIDPVTAKEIAIDVQLPDFSEAEIHEIYDLRKLDFDTTRLALEDLLASYIAESSKREMSRAMKDAVKYAFDNCGAKLGETITEEQRQRFAALLPERLTPFILHQLGIPASDRDDQGDR